MSSSWDVIVDALPVLAQGSVVTLKITVISLFFALLIGLLFGLMSTSRSKILRGIATAYVDFLRGTPLLVQIFFIYFGLPPVLDIKIPETTAGILALSLNAGAYLAEIFRGGILSIDKGQMEAARSLGLTHGKAMRLVILPQAVRRMIPAFVNQFIVTLKDTSLLTVIGIRELMNSGEIIISSNFRSFEIWAVVAVFYFLMIYILSLLSRSLERRFAK
ncbi:amino acid ABC transporter permease [Brevibacillus formosus]|uniref:Nickel transporter n=2 Tax=Brevibacillus TaxID=55080 RepID=A0A837KT46_9BACL|nr:MULTISPECIES: amino acid ABC transporter permease [Brevibacillus]AWX58983.1 amino acid ABC transporter permease [Brevibacillus brevis]EJL29165.1 amine acid ABC transporter, permease protein, 3-TM region, His/Glu/Gln/Arg/opine family [Brevibacillus sp. BC25]KLH99339.1 nickel transporter [Brevibacillus formosus]MBW5469094.1 ABC transporter permease subunit [Brevibacillus formosus]MED1945098.1 amino acid ABC transporter permease [Brevibacillus formosus]